jgi:hypothetical protein
MDLEERSPARREEERDDEPASTPLSEIEDDPGQAPGRVDAAEAVTGSRPEPGGESPPGGIPGDDSSLEGGNPA